jgi:molybdenum cofactor cytidylyltransferase
VSVVDNPKIGAIVLAAGLSSRMGVPKMALPWGDTTVIGQVVRVLSNAGLDEIIVVTGGAQDEVRQALQGLPVVEVYNPDHQKGEMLSSLQSGLSNLGNHLEAALVVLGDQPQIQERVVKALIKVYTSDRSPLVVPSYQMRRGHPWLLGRSLWPVVLELKRPDTLRDFLNEHQTSIQYVTIDTPTILQDLDSPADYHKYRPGRSHGKK